MLISSSLPGPLVNCVKIGRTIRYALRKGHGGGDLLDSGGVLGGSVLLLLAVRVVVVLMLGAVVVFPVLLAVSTVLVSPSDL